MIGRNKEKSEQIKENHATIYTMKRKNIVVYIIILAMVSIMLSGLYFNYAWNKYQNETSSKAIQLAQSVASIIHPEHIEELSGGSEDLEKTTYTIVKNGLSRLVEANSAIRFAYLLGEQDGSIIFLVDSESSDSQDYSPPGQVYEEADDIVWTPFRTGESVLTIPRTDRWGTWISALIPIKNPISGTVIAVLGIDYPAAAWNLDLRKQMVPDIIIVLCIIMLIIVLNHLWFQHFNLKNTNNKLKLSETLYHSLFNQAPIGIAIVDDKNFVYESDFGQMNINPMLEQILGRSSHELINIKWTEITHPEDLQADLENFERFKKGEINGYSMEKRFIKPDGSFVWVYMVISALQLLGTDMHNHICLIQDITENKAQALKLEQSMNLFYTFINSNQDFVFLKDENSCILFANETMAKNYGMQVHELIGKTAYDFMSNETAFNLQKTDEITIKKNNVVTFIQNINNIIYETRKFPVALGEGRIGIGAYIRDITRDYLKQELINKISETNRIISECMLKSFTDIQKQLDFALHEAIRLTESQYGYIYFYDENAKEFTLNSWTNGVMYDCSIIEKQTKYQLDKTGIWGEVVRQRKPIIINDFAAPNSLKKGYPEGHVIINKFMSIPIFENDHIIAVIGFANKTSDYTDNDVEAMTALMSGVWIATRRKEKEKETEILLARTQSMFHNHEAVMLLIEPYSGKIVEANVAATSFYGYSKDELLNMAIQDLNTLDKEEISKLRLKALNKGQKYFTFPHRLRNGEIRMVDVYSCPIEYNGNKVLFSIIFDVTEREESKKQTEYLAYHDHLTGLYNRRFFDDEFVRRKLDTDNYPLTILMGDVNGLKGYNDTFGHLEGDHALIDIASRLKKSIKNEDILARVGGDEFAVIISAKTEEEIREYLEEIDQQVNFNDTDMTGKYATISLGYGIQRKTADSLDNLLKEAESFMYNRKYYNSKSAKSNTVNVIMETLFTKNEREKKHSERVGLICEAIATKLNLDKQSIDQARVAGFLHDIGKIGIDESILNKVGKLDKNEWEIMKLHSAKGARILENTLEYKDIADYLLSHHERYNGSGYPKGLRGEQIPLISRIIAVADSYDAITNDRSYREKMSSEEALCELRKCSGVLFDPEIVSVFIDKVLPENSFSRGG